jgi:peroxiredoxin
LRGFEERLNDFNLGGVQVVAISADPPAVTRAHCQKLGYTYTFLSDPSAEVIRGYDLLHVQGGPGGHDISRPAEFLIDSAGVVRWVNLTDDLRVRTRPEQVLQVIDQMEPIQH